MHILNIMFLPDVFLLKYRIYFLIFKKGKQDEASRDFILIKIICPQEHIWSLS